MKPSSLLTIDIQYYRQKVPMGASIYRHSEAVAGLFLLLWVIGHTGFEVIMVDL